MLAVGHLSGGLGHVTVLVSVAFSSMSRDNAPSPERHGPGLVALETMREVGGFRDGFAAALTAAAPAAAAPPNRSTFDPARALRVEFRRLGNALFLGGVVPGLVMALTLMATVTVVARRTGLEQQR